MIMQRLCPDLSRLRELLDGDLSADEQAGLTAHLDTCPDCQQTLENLAAGVEAWSETARHLRQAGRPDATVRRLVAEIEAPAETADEPRSTSVSGELPAGFLQPSADATHLGRLGPYEVLEVIGHGGNGVVLKALDPGLNRLVAIKVLAPQLATSAAARRRFRREAQAAAAVAHEHVVAIHAVEETNGLPYLVMQYVAGTSLQERLDRQGPLALDEVLRIGMQTAAGLAAAHAQGLVHRDVKPGNILLENGVERVKLTDFGLARAVDDASLTHSGLVAGTPQYMAPEQARGEAVDHRADLFSLGSVLYACCTGRPPFRAGSNLAILRRVSDDTPRPVREINAEVPEWLADLIATLHAKDPAERFASAAEVSTLLGQFLAHVQQPTRVPRPAWKPRRPARRAGNRRRGGVALAALGLLGLVLAADVAAEGPLSRFLGTVLRIETAEGTLVLRVEDPAVKVTVDGNREVVITGAGVGELRLRVGPHQVMATKDGKILKQETVRIEKDGKAVVTVEREPPAPDAGVSPGANAAQVPLPPLPVPGAVPGTRYFPVQPRLSPAARYQAWPTEARPTGIAIWSLAFAPDGKTLAVGYGGVVGKAGGLQLWDPASGQQRLSIAEPHSVHSLAYSPDGKTLATAEFDDSVKLRDAATGKVRIVLQGHTSSVNSAAFAPNGNLVATASWDRTVRLWDAATGKEVRSLEGHTDEVYSVAFSADGRSLVSGGADYSARVWDVDTGAGRLVLRGHTDVVEAVAFAPDSKQVATASWDRTVKLWDAATGRELATLRGHTVAVLGLAYAPDGNRLASCSGGWGDPSVGANTPGPGDVRLWNVRTHQEVAVVEGFTNRIFALAFAPDGKSLAIGDWSGTIKVLDVAANPWVQRQLQQPAAPVAAPAAGAGAAPGTQPPPDAPANVPGRVPSRPRPGPGPQPPAEAR